MKRKRNNMHALDAVIITAAAVFVLLDTFLIPHTYASANNASASVNTSTVSSSSSTASNSAAASSTSPQVSDTSYSDDNISITISTYAYDNTTVYVADVQLSSIDYLKTALADNTYGRNVTETASTIADSVNAILAINGDFYGAQNSGYVLRNGTLYRDSSDGGQEDLVINSDGSFSIISESETSASSLQESGALQVLSFGPVLIENGQIAVDTNDEVGKAMASNPRTAICEIEPLHYLFVVSDGRTSESQGLTLYQMAEFLQSLGVKTAYNLDGGGSSTMVFNGSVVNKPTTDGRTIQERSVSDIVYIGY
ncbi:MAG: phosphodiester glycosidase family protein [Solobacterium sp.]|jgi:exopolysaccharide biosynthesis protein|nr:phosphodiester glycosidase family protein [Solobacterium sp.]MCH4047967.1 phosphodiester glycosidase family protein [Solobacterium sp.]MCH4075447.1 phosphodiester glycosidase family protein [Solobacterium sp.]MCI1314561.1 phosphodiester glycosidase family protein [Solobacterium sp.]MCI1346766.1 phosphodiester glycosidase family protein [Solobacterium sp.]